MGSNMLFSLQTDGSSLFFAEEPGGRSCLFSVFMSVIVDSEEEEGKPLAGVQHDDILHCLLLHQSINAGGDMPLLMILFLLAAVVSTRTAEQTAPENEGNWLPRCP